MAIARLSEAFFRLERKGKYGIYVFMSKDWKSTRPWTYEGTAIPYFYSKHTTKRQIGTMTSWFIGPLCFVSYKIKK